MATGWGNLWSGCVLSLTLPNGNQSHVEDVAFLSGQMLNPAHLQSNWRLLCSRGKRKSMVLTQLQNNSRSSLQPQVAIMGCSWAAPPQFNLFCHTHAWFSHVQWSTLEHAGLSLLQLCPYGLVCSYTPLHGQQNVTVCKSAAFLYIPAGHAQLLSLAATRGGTR